VKSVKKIIRGQDSEEDYKGQDTNEDKWCRALLQYRNTPSRKDGFFTSMAKIRFLLTTLLLNRSGNKVRQRLPTIM